MTAKTDLPPVPPALEDVALIDGPTSAAAGGISLSTWHDLVRNGQAPAPVIRQSRCTRWRMLDVRNWLIERASQQTTGDAVLARAKQASIKAREPAAIAKAQATRTARIAARQAAQAGG